MFIYFTNGCVQESPSNVRGLRAKERDEAPPASKVSKNRKFGFEPQRVTAGVILGGPRV